LNVGDKYTSFSLGSLYATFALSAAAMILCVVIAPLLFLNSYQTVTTWWKGPPMVYLLSFITGKNYRFAQCQILHNIILTHLPESDVFFVHIAALGMVAIGIFLDFYIWDMNSEVIFIDSTALEGDRTSFRYLLDNEGYTLNKELHYSFGIHVGGITSILNYCLHA
jgi:hypothetical protein